MLLLISLTLKSGGEAGIDTGPRFVSSSPFKYFILALVVVLYVSYFYWRKCHLHTYLSYMSV